MPPESIKGSLFQSRTNTNIVGHHLQASMFPMELLPKAFGTIGKLFPASWGYKLMTESVFKFENFLPFLLIFVLAVVTCNILLRRVDK